MGKINDNGEEDEVSYPSVPLLPEGVSEEEFCAALDISFAEMQRRQAFIDAVATGTDPVLAGIEMGWTIRKTNIVIKEMAELIEVAQNVMDLRVSAVIADRALNGHEWAVKLWIFNRRPDLFKDVRHIEHRHTNEMQPHVISATVAAVREVVTAAIGSGRVAELQPPILDAEVIE